MRAIILLCLLEAAFIQAQEYAWGGNDGTDENTTSNACSTEGACGCCLMLQETERLKTHFIGRLSELEDIYTKTNQALNQIKTVRTAFSVALFSAGGFQCRGPFSVNTIIVYEHIFLNMGNGYDVNTGIFTVPHSGVYSIALTIYSDAGSSSNTLKICISLRVNGQVVAKSNDHNSDDEEDSSSIVMAINLKTADKLDVILHENCLICDDSLYNTFSAFLLHED